MHISPDVLVEALRSQGLRITTTRRAVCAVIASRHGQHLTAATIVDDLRSDEVKIDQSTVYRTLDALEEAGLLVHSHLGHGPAVYHLPSEAAHQHVVCSECGATATVPTDSLSGWIGAVRDTTGFEIDPTHFAVTGLCRTCAAKR
ncbi:MAG: Fur family transcriptional regulator [Acidimicrobiia bacterium]|nr:Fur family transcriptional regulator [Acidimicrobiia bacterium]